MFLYKYPEQHILEKRPLLSLPDTIITRRDGDVGMKQGGRGSCVPSPCLWAALSFVPQTRFSSAGSVCQHMGLCLARRRKIRCRISVHFAGFSQALSNTLNAGRENWAPWQCNPVPQPWPGASMASVPRRTISGPSPSEAPIFLRFPSFLNGFRPSKPTSAFTVLRRRELVPAIQRHWIGS